MTMNIRQPLFSRRNPLPDGVSWSRRVVAGEALEFTISAFCCAGDSCSPKAFQSKSARAVSNLLLVLLKARGSLVTKEELLSRVWPGRRGVGRELEGSRLALRKSTGADRDLIRTEFGPGSIHWRTAVIPTAAPGC